MGDRHVVITPICQRTYVAEQKSRQRPHTVIRLHLLVMNHTKTDVAASLTWAVGTLHTHSKQ